MSRAPHRKVARAVGLVLALVLAQAALIGLYWWVESPRSTEPEGARGTDPPHRVDLPMPTLTVVSREGDRVALPLPDRALVHVWATWCPPCRAELPGLLAVEPKHGIDVVAIALDGRWNAVDRFLGDLDSSDVFLAGSADVGRALGVRRLPVTFLVEAGRITRRFDGARDWTDESWVRRSLELDD